MSKAKKLSLPSNDAAPSISYKSKDLIWAKMKGFTPWPAMVVDPPPVDLVGQTHRHSSKCVFFFGTRNFAWIEVANMKPFEGPWKADLAKVTKPNSFRQAMQDINSYQEDPAEIDADISANTAPPNHATEADFDKIRDGVGQSDDEAMANNDAAADTGNGDIGPGYAAVESAAPALTPKASGKRTPKAKAQSKSPASNAKGGKAALLSQSAATTTPPSTAAASIGSGGTPISGGAPPSPAPSASSGVAAAASAPTKASSSASSKRRRSSGGTAATTGTTTTNTTTTPINVTNKRKRKGSDQETFSDYMESPSPTGRRKINTDALAHIGAISRRNVNSIALLDRPVVPRPEAQQIDMNSRSQTLAEREITPSNLTFGFLGLGIMGSTIVKDLICTGHKVVVWNRTMSKCAPFAEAGAGVKDTPMEVVEASDIIFCCVSDPKASKDLVFGNCGVLQYKDLCNKAYVEMSTIDPDTSTDIAEGINAANGRYLEVQVHGTRQDAEDGMLIILAGGDRTVFEECHSCFKTIAKNTFFLGAEVGNACKVNLILQTIMGVSLVGLSEALALADRFSISLKDIIDIFELTSMKSTWLLNKGREMAKGDFHPQQPLSHLQKDLRLVLNMAENLDQSMPVTAITNEVFKHTKRLGYSDHDSSAVFVRSRF